MPHYHIRLLPLVAESHTVDATPVSLTILDVSKTVPPGCTSCCGLMKSTIMARGETSSQGDCWVVRRSWKWTAAGHLTWTGTTSKVYTGKEDAAWDVDHNVSSDLFQITVTGDAAEHVEWTCFPEFYINADN